MPDGNIYVLDGKIGAIGSATSRMFCVASVDEASAPIDLTNLKSAQHPAASTAKTSDPADERLTRHAGTVLKIIQRVNDALVESQTPVIATPSEERLTSTQARQLEAERQAQHIPTEIELQAQARAIRTIMEARQAKAKAALEEAAILVRQQAKQREDETRHLFEEVMANDARLSAGVKLQAETVGNKTVSHHVVHIEEKPSATAPLQSKAWFPGDDDRAMADQALLARKSVPAPVVDAAPVATASRIVAFNAVAYGPFIGGSASVLRGDAIPEPAVAARPYAAPTTETATLPQAETKDSVQTGEAMPAQSVVSRLRNFLRPAVALAYALFWSDSLPAKTPEVPKPVTTQSLQDSKNRPAPLSDKPCFDSLFGGNVKPAIAATPYFDDIFGSKARAKPSLKGVRT